MSKLKSAFLVSLVRLLVLFVFIFTLCILALAQYTAVSTNVDAEDEFVFKKVLKLNRQADLDFSQQILLIRGVQKAVFEIAPLGPPIPDYQDREPEDLIRHGAGLCYDRSRTLDKVYKWLGFETRHIYILYKENAGNEKNSIAALLAYGQPSHAATEVKTSKGWLVVDSNSEWISLDINGLPVGADDIWKEPSRFEYAPAYMLKPYWAIRGLYSRRGHLYKPHVPFPEINPSDFFNWILNG